MPGKRSAPPTRPTALITGGAKGMGAAITLALANGGHRVNRFGAGIHRLMDTLPGNYAGSQYLDFGGMLGIDRPLAVNRLELIQRQGPGRILLAGAMASDLSLNVAAEWEALQWPPAVEPLFQSRIGPPLSSICEIVGRRQ